MNKTMTVAIVAETSSRFCDAIHRILMSDHFYTLDWTFARQRPVPPRHPETWVFSGSERHIVRRVGQSSVQVQTAGGHIFTVTVTEEQAPSPEYATVGEPRD